MAEQSSDPQQRLLLRRNTQTYRYASLKIVFVPLVFILTRIWGTIRFILDLIPNSTVRRIAAWLAPFQVSDFQLRWCVRALSTCPFRFVKRWVTVVTVYVKSTGNDVMLLSLASLFEGTNVKQTFFCLTHN